MYALLLNHGRHVVAQIISEYLSSLSPAIKTPEVNLVEGDIFGLRLIYLEEDAENGHYEGECQEVEQCAHDIRCDASGQEALVGGDKPPYESK